MSDNELQAQVDKLGKHGREVWDKLAEEWKLDTPTQALALQACRLIDRTDRLEAALKSKGTWIRIADESDLGQGAVKITVTIDSVLAEARQQALALNAILHKLGVGKLEEAIPRGSSFADTLKEIREL